MRRIIAFSVSMVNAAFFWSRVNRADGPAACWLWTGPRNSWGYGRVWSFEAQTVLQAHRVAWTLVHGPVPVGLYVCHHCDTPPCCNPAHLFLGTQRDNVADSFRKGRGRGQKKAAQA